MKLLLDENLPKRLKQDYSSHEIFTVHDLGWNGIKNGKLLELMIENGFAALLTFDKNLQHQQNFNKYSIVVFVLSASNNTYIELSKLTIKILNLLKNGQLEPGPIVVSSNETRG